MTTSSTFADRLAALGLLRSPPPDPRDPRRRLRSACSVDRTAAVLADGLKAEGAAICVNTPAWSECGRPGRLMLFVSPDGGPDRELGLCLPWKALVQEDQAGDVWILWQDPEDWSHRSAAA